MYSVEIWNNCRIQFAYDEFKSCLVLKGKALTFLNVNVAQQKQSEES